MKPSPVKVSVAIITYNRPEALEKCLRSLKTQSRKPHEIIVIDSSDNTESKKTVGKNKLSTKYRKFSTRLRQCKARNEALKICSSDIIAYIDDDCMASHNWLENIAKGYTDENIVAVGGPCINVDEKMQPSEMIINGNSNRNFVSFTGDIVCEARRWIPKQTVETQMLAGGNMSFRVAFLKGIGGFDEFYDKHAAFREETDPQIAILRKGLKIMYVPGALTYHLNLRSGGIFSDKMEDYYYWCGVNHRYLIDKYKFSKFWSRLSWLTFSRSPPSIPIAIAVRILHGRKGIMQWYKGLFRSEF